MVQVNRAASSGMARAVGWSFEIEDLVLYVPLRHRRRSEHTYLLRVTFEEFPRRAPSYVFVDRQSKEVTEAAWPPGVNAGVRFPESVRRHSEFHEKYHANDAQYAWDAERYTFLDTLLRIQKMMEHGLGG